MISLYISTNSKGRGVYALHDLTINTIIEQCPVIIINPGVQDLYDYVFQWDDERVAIALGYGSLYNHSFKPNVIYNRDLENKVIKFTSLKAIKKDDELLVNYNGDPKDNTPIWFDLV